MMKKRIQIPITPETRQRFKDYIKKNASEFRKFGINTSYDGVLNFLLDCCEDDSIFSLQHVMNNSVSSPVKEEDFADQEKRREIVNNKFEEE